ncbi:MAG: HAMP domain-containing sensor histidine kinase [Eubacteriales bacterium]|nr:HAMP domain-containing sensor histidine kinase [Eubacteriales bacterium]
MEHLILAASLLCILVLLLLLYRSRRYARRMTETIERMLDAALEGEYSEQAFDESRLSALESRFVRYLSASTLSAASVRQEKDRIKELISDISHQTKTPIANLLLYCDLISEEELTEELRANVNALQQQAEKLRFLIDSLVKLSRLETGILAFSPKPASVLPMLEDIYQQFLPLAGSKNLMLTLDAPDLRAVFDEKWTTEALANLVDNAVKYTPSGEISLSAVAYELFVRIDIRDTGIGIPEEEQAEIFGRFYRSEAVRNQPGVGIGLFLAREIITGQGGYIKLTSTPGKGSVFSLFLPTTPEM